MGIVEGLTEFLPVSSTGHLILAGELFNFTGAKATAFEICVQFGAIAAVVLLYWPRFWGLLQPHGPAFSGLRGLGLLVLTTLPGALLGLLAHGMIKSLFTPASVTAALAVGAVCMLAVEHYTKNKKLPVNSIDALTPRLALGIGLFQCLALWPGFSRSASTIMGSMLLGVNRKTAAEYSFIAAVPLIVGASGYELLSSWHLFSTADLPFFAVGTLSAFVSALIAIKGFIALLGRMTLRPFAFYRLLLVIPVYWFMVHG